MRVGILGGGQLARMLALEAHRLGIDLVILCTNADDPAAQVCGQTQLGKLDDPQALQDFFSDISIGTVESEFIDTDVVARAMGKVDFAPGLPILARLQDRLSQKELLEAYDIPTARFIGWNHEAPHEVLFPLFPKGFVLKKRRFGYDGYGTFIFKNKGAQEAPPQDRYGYIAEEWIPFTRELAFSLARNADGQIAVFPLVETFQVNSRCLWAKGPVNHPKFGSLTKRFKKLMKDLNYRGILAVELFDVKGQLIVNELAPRVHNSAHYSQDALNLNQFEAHLRGILNWPLKNPEPLSKAFAMVNLLGEGGATRLSRSLNGQLHWYGKKENRPGRKLGHLNTLGSTSDEALKKALRWRKGFEL